MALFGERIQPNKSTNQRFEKKDSLTDKEVEAIPKTLMLQKIVDEQSLEWI